MSGPSAMIRGECPNASHENDGLMTKEDKKKVSGIISYTSASAIDQFALVSFQAGLGPLIEELGNGTVSTADNPYTHGLLGSALDAATGPGQIVRVQALSAAQTTTVLLGSVSAVAIGDLIGLASPASLGGPWGRVEKSRANLRLNSGFLIAASAAPGLVPDEPVQVLLRTCRDTNEVHDYSASNADGFFTTPGATPTTALIIPYRVGLYEIYVCARTVASPHVAAGFFIRSAYGVSAALVATQLGTTQDAFIDPALAGIVAVPSVLVAGPNAFIRVAVTGLAATTIVWSVIIRNVRTFDPLVPLGP